MQFLRKGVLYPQKMCSHRKGYRDMAPCTKQIYLCMAPCTKQIYMCIHVYVSYAYTCVYVCIYMRVYTCVYVCKCMYTLGTLAVGTKMVQREPLLNHTVHGLE